MGEAKTIQSTSYPVTIDRICQDLSSLGVKRGDTLLVHSSLSSLGWVCGGAQAVVIALLSATGADRDESSPECGTLVMPAHSGDLSDPAEWAHPPVPKDWLQTIYDTMPPYIPQITPTRGIGRIPELFRIFPGVLRSDHPQVSFCAGGRKAQWVTGGHPLTPQFGMDSPLGKMYGLDAGVLMLGADYDTCTCFHLAEALFDRMPVKRMGTSMLENGERVWKWFEDFGYDSGDFDRIGEAFEQECEVRKGAVGNAQCRLFPIRAGVDFALKWLQENRK